MPVWPQGAELAVSLTFDVDAESSLISRSAGYRTRLSSLSEANFGVTRGLPRILEILASAAAPATFYVPGYTAELHREAIEAIVEAGHEIGHHGYMHLRSHEIDATAQREELERGIEALTTCTGKSPAGYRSPGWELTPDTLALLGEFNFTHDSSLMGDDRPYLLTSETTQLLELPVHWSLDDVPYFAFSVDNPGRLHDPAAMRKAWLAELASARRDRRHLTLTMHPEIIGRGHRADELQRLLDEIRDSGPVWFARHHDLTELLLPPPSGTRPARTRAG